MANAKTHMVVGGIAGIAMLLADRNSSPESKQSPIAAAAVSTLFAKLPDILEPATSPHHRQFFHSIGVLGAVGYGMKKAYDWEPADDLESMLRFLALSACAGYVSHLLLDGTTPRSLPMLGKL
jgi:membrane-bound metal-dependent hydrolase YbcI (DUF457 family)